MKNLTCAFAAIAMIAIAAPTIASAQDVGVTVGSDHRDRGIEVRHDNDGAFRSDRDGRDFRDARYRSEAHMVVYHHHHHHHHHW